MVESYKVSVYSKAEKDLLEILAYLKENAGNQIAEEIQKDFIETLNKLTKRPTSFSVFRPDQYPSHRFRKAIIKKAWNLIYEIDQDTYEIYVIRILHVKRSTSFIKKNIK